MKQRVNSTDVNKSSLYLNIALAAAVFIQICLYINRRGFDSLDGMSLPIEEGCYLISLLLLIGVVCTRFFFHARLRRQAEAGRDQLEALISMFRVVKHKLNNDMQVVLGNAELAQNLLAVGGNLAKPVNNITAAANDAVERIEHLSVFGSNGYANPTPVDLNSMFRENMAKLAEELPRDVSLRLELDQLSSRVVADRSLLTLSLTHLIRLAVTSMRHGGEIVIRTVDCNSRASRAQHPVVARIYIVKDASVSRERGASLSIEGEHISHVVGKEIDEFHNGLKISKALVERSGVQSVCLTHSGNESLFTMHFATELRSEHGQDSSLVPELYS